MAVGTTQATLSLTTNENATCRWATAPNTAYSAMPNPFTTTGAAAHSALRTGLVNGGSYTHYVRCQDGAGNANTTDFTISFSVSLPADTTPPTAPTAPRPPSSPVGTTQATLSLTTNENATCQWATPPTPPTARCPTPSPPPAASAHSALRTGLTNGVRYTYYVRCQDAANNANSTDFTISLLRRPAGPTSLLQFSLANYSVSETGPTATITVTRTLSDRSPRPRCTTRPATARARAGTDYTHSGGRPRLPGRRRPASRSPSP